MEGRKDGRMEGRKDLIGRRRCLNFRLPCRGPGATGPEGKGGREGRGEGMMDGWVERRKGGEGKKEGRK